MKQVTNAIVAAQLGTKPSKKIYIAISDDEVDDNPKKSTDTKMDGDDRFDHNFKKKQPKYQKAEL